AQFQERARGVDEPLDSFPREELTSLMVAPDVLFSAGEGNPVEPRAQIRRQVEIRGAVGAVGGVAKVDAGRKLGDVVPFHGASLQGWTNAIQPWARCACLGQAASRLGHATCALSALRYRVSADTIAE